MEDYMRQTLDIAPGARFAVDAEMGSIRVRTHDLPRIDVEVMRRVNGWEARGAGPIEEDILLAVEQTEQGIQMELRIDEARRLWYQNGRAQIETRLAVPKRLDLALKTSGGSIQVEDLEGAVSAKTSGGSIRLGRIDGRVNAKTAGGGIHLDGSKGTATLKTAGGSIHIGQVDGDVEAGTSGGSIHVGCVTGRTAAHTSGGSIHLDRLENTVEAVTSGGSVTARIERQPADACRLETSGGSIHAYLAEGIALHIDARTSGGRVTADLPIAGRIDDHGIQGALNGGGPALILRTSGGSVRIHRLEPKGVAE
jgi:DUF4097 and DUF4098 domain-containing protein YvlB